MPLSPGICWFPIPPAILKPRPFPPFNNSISRTRGPRACPFLLTAYTDNTKTFNVAVDSERENKDEFCTMFYRNSKCIFPCMQTLIMYTCSYSNTYQFHSVSSPLQSINCCSMSYINNRNIIDPHDHVSNSKPSVIGCCSS